jgi:CHAT domain-containing protein/tetratricopeptide (TPR) repeat protein
MPLLSLENSVSQSYLEQFNQAENLRLSGNFDKSIEYFKNCLSLAKKSGNKKEEMNSLMKLALLSWNIGQQKLAENYYLSSSSIARNLGLKNIEEDCNKAIQIYKLYSEGKDYRNSGDYQKSIESFKTAISLSKEINSPEHELKCLRQTSINFLELNDFQEFFALNKEALSLTQKIKNQKDEGICLNNIGVYFWKIANYSEALKYYEKALEIAQKINNLQNEADVLTNISIYYADLGNFEKSIELLLKVLKIDQQTGLTDKIPMDLNNIGIAYRRKAILTDDNNDFNMALRYFDDCLNLVRINSKIKIEIKALNNIGSVYSQQNKNYEALKYFEAAYKKAEKTDDIEEMSIILNNIGIVHSNQGDYEQSAKYFQKAIDFALEIKGGQTLWEAFFEIGNSFKKQSKFIEAKEKYENSITIIEGVRSTIELEELKASYFGTDKRLEAYHNMIEILFNLNKSAPQKGYDIEAFNYLERAKARAFLDSLEVSEVSISQGIDFKLSNREIQLSNKISSLYKKLLQTESTPEQRNKISEDIKNYEDQLDKLKLEIRMTSPAYADLKYPQIITLKEVQENLLDGKTAFFAYSIGKDSSYGFAISKRGFKIFPISPRNNIQKKVTEYKKTISDKDNLDFRIGFELYSELVRPGLDEKIQKLVFFPDDILYFLPFETLLTQRNNRQWLINKYTIAYAPSISSLREIIKRSKNNGKRRGKDLLAFGDPVYDEEDSGNSEKNSIDLFQNFYSPQGLKLFRLNYSGMEVQRIASLFRKTKEQVFLREKASEAVLKSQKLEDFKIIHFAAHAVIDDQKPARSLIVLSLNQDSRQYDFVQMRDIYNLKMNSDLVTLSACQTGLGQFIRGEGIEGLSRAFFYAGASSVLMSLWAVNDQASYQLMERFYYHLRSSESIMEALQKAKLEMIRSGVFSHPFYWAGFVITGNAGKVVFPKTVYKWIPVIISLCIGGTFLIGVKNLRKRKARRLAARLCYRVSHD